MTPDPFGTNGDEQMNMIYPTPNHSDHLDTMLGTRIGLIVIGGVIEGVHTLTAHQANRLDAVAARVRHSARGLRIDLGDYMTEITGGEITRITPVRYPRGYGSPYLFVEWLTETEKAVV